MNEEIPKKSEEELYQLAKQMGALAQQVKAGRVPIEEAAETLTKPPFNIRGIYRARQILDPGPPTP